MYPKRGYGYVDFTIIISGSKWRTIESYPHGIVDAISFAYEVKPDCVSVFRIAAIEDDVVMLILSKKIVYFCSDSHVCRKRLRVCILY